MKAKKFGQQFDEGVDLTASLDLSKAKRVLQEQKRVNVDFPNWMIDSLSSRALTCGPFKVDVESVTRSGADRVVFGTMSEPACQRYLSDLRLAVFERRRFQVTGWNCASDS